MCKLGGFALIFAMSNQNNKNNMEKIGTIENVFNLYEDNGKLVCIAESENVKVQIKKFEFYERMSEETNCFVCNVYINGKNVGEGRNEGQGGPTWVYANNHPLANTADEVFRKVEDYCFPRRKLSLNDVVDQLGSIQILLNDNKVKGKSLSVEVKSAIARNIGKQIVEYLNKCANKYRAEFSK